MAWEPFNIAVLAKHLLALAFNVHKPAWVGAVHKLGTTAVTVRIAVANVVDFPYNAAFVQGFGDGFVDFPDVGAFPFGFGVFTIFVEHVYDGDFFGARQGEVFFTVRRGDVHNTRT